MISTMAEAACDKYQASSTWSTTNQFKQWWPTNGQECGIQQNGTDLNIMSCQPNGLTFNYCGKGSSDTCSKCIDAYSQAAGQPSQGQADFCQSGYEFQGTCYNWATVEVTENCTTPAFIDPTVSYTMRKTVCGSGFYCEVMNSSLPCQKIKNINDPCVNGYECQSHFCSGGKCFAPYSVSEGSTCGASHECASGCCTTGGVCVKPFSQGAGTQMKDSTGFCCAPGTYMDSTSRCVAYPTTAPSCSCSTTGWDSNSFGNPAGRGSCSFGTCDCAAGNCTIPDKAAEQAAADCLLPRWDSYLNEVLKPSYDGSLDAKTTDQMTVKYSNILRCCRKKAGIEIGDWTGQSVYEVCTSPASALQVSMGLMMVLMVAMAFFL